MYFGFFLTLLFGILLVVLSVNGRLQNVIAAMFGQQAPGATPTGGTGTSSSGGGGLGGLLGGLLNSFSIPTGAPSPGSPLGDGSGDGGIGGFIPGG